MRVSELLEDVLALANDGIPIPQRTVMLLPSGRPGGTFAEAGQKSRKIALLLLEMLANPDGTEAFDCAVGAVAIPMVIYSSGNGRDHERGLIGTDVACLAPVTTDGDKTVIAILALARATPHPGGGALANRVAKCRKCERFFLLPTLRPSKFCSKRCRERARIRRRKPGSDRPDRR